MDLREHDLIVLIRYGNVQETVTTVALITDGPLKTNVKADTGHDRAQAVIATGNSAARRTQATDAVLQRALDAGRG